VNCEKGRGQEIDNRPLPPVPSRKGKGRTSQSLLYVFLAIPILYLVALVAFPVAYNVVMSLQEVTLGNIVAFSRPWVGLDNYREVLGDPDFHKVLLNSLLFVAANVVAQLGIGLAAALFFSQRFPGVHFLRGLLLAAWMLPALVVGALWKWLFATQYGVINFVIGRPVHWLADPSLSLASVTIANIWFGMPFSMILVSAALTGIPLEPYEAASLDGAGPLQRFRYITLPALRPALLAIACLITIYTMRAFDLIFAMTGGGPLDSSNVLPLFSYQFTFQQFRFGIGAAIGTFAFVIVFTVALLYVHTLRREASE
jgi:multiple sugar transport system permease protein